MDPTPIERIDGLWVKRDDRTDVTYGGNKVRKLAHLLAEAKSLGAIRILTIGAAGSHHVLATTVHGKHAGFEVDAVLVPQVRTDHVSQNLRTGLALGLNPYPAANYLNAGIQYAWLRRRKGTYAIWLGGSSVCGSRGYVEAALELAAQVKRGMLPEPAQIVVALGSGGTAAGLAVGLEKAGLKTKIVGVAISDPVWFLRSSTLWLIRHLAQDAAVAPEGACARLVVVDAVGKGYGVPTSAGERALAWGASHGLLLDPTYTAKACAVALAQEREGTLYWHTLSHGVPKVALADEASLAPKVRTLLTM